MPGARLNLAVVYQGTGRPDLAEENYLAALRMDPDFTPARANPAQFMPRGRDCPTPRRSLVEGVKQGAGAGRAVVLLGLVQAEQGCIADAAARRLGRAGEAAARARVHYNLGPRCSSPAAQRDRRTRLSDAARLDPRDAAAFYAPALLFAQDKRWDALGWPSACRPPIRAIRRRRSWSNGCAPRPGGGRSSGPAWIGRSMRSDT